MSCRWTRWGWRARWRRRTRRRCKHRPGRAPASTVFSWREQGTGFFAAVHVLIVVDFVGFSYWCCYVITALLRTTENSSIRWLLYYDTTIIVQQLLHWKHNFENLIFRWDINIGSVAESRLKELYPLMPVMYIKAITQDKQVKNLTY
jgi:hypothetical protein